MLRKICLLACITFIFSCNVEKEQDALTTGVSYEELRAKAKAEKEAAFKAFLETREGQDLISRKIGSNEGAAKKGGKKGGDVCDCFYSISEVEIGAATDQGFTYELWSSVNCVENNPFTCKYFGTHFSTFYPVCSDIDLSCTDVLDGTLPVSPTTFNCEIPTFATFDAVFSAGGINVSGCAFEFLEESSITFNIICCDRAVGAGSDLNECGDISQCYSSDPITINLDGGWDTIDEVVLSLEGCGCEPVVL